MVAIIDDLVYKKSKLGYIYNGSRVFLIKKRDSVGLVKSDSYVKDWDAPVILCFSVFDQADVTGFAVFIGRIIGDVYPLLMVSAFVPVVKKSQDLFLADRRKKTADR